VAPTALAHLLQDGLARLEPGVADGVADPKGPLDGPGGDLGELLVALVPAGHGPAAAVAMAA